MAENSKKQIAQAFGVKQPSIHKMERQAGPNLVTLRRFAAFASNALTPIGRHAGFNRSASAAGQLSWPSAIPPSRTRAEVGTQTLVREARAPTSAW